MAWVNAKAKRRLSVVLAAGVIFSATCAVVAFPESAVAADHRGGGEHRGGNWDHGGNWNRGGN